jgi:hypothetical protein
MPIINPEFLRGFAYGFFPPAVFTVFAAFAWLKRRNAISLMLRHPAFLLLFLSTFQSVAGICWIFLGIMPRDFGMNWDWHYGTLWGAYGLPGITMVMLILLNWCYRYAAVMRK